MHKQGLGCVQMIMCCLKDQHLPHSAVTWVSLLSLVQGWVHALLASVCGI